MRHEICPSTMTIESLKDWIRTNKVDSTNHMEKIPLTTDEINELQRESSMASRASDKLKGTLKYFTELIKKGTPWDSANEMHRPISVTIPPSKGLEKLEANRKFADLQLENGFREEVTPIFFIPWPEFEKMVAMDIEGNEWSAYSRDMTKDEVAQHGRPVLQASRQLREDLAESGIKIDKVEGRTVHLSMDDKLKKNKQPKLSEVVAFSTSTCIVLNNKVSSCSVSELY